MQLRLRFADWLAPALLVTSEMEAIGIPIDLDQVSDLIEEAIIIEEAN
jgi:hypothetical protein